MNPALVTLIGELIALGVQVTPEIQSAIAAANAKTQPTQAQIDASMAQVKAAVAVWQSLPSA